MMTLLVHMLKYQPDYPTIPLVAKIRWIWVEAVRLATQLKGAVERAEL